MNNNFLRLRSQKLLNIYLAEQLKKRGKNMIRNMKKFRCPYCGGRLFDFVTNNIEPRRYYTHMIIKCWKCRTNVKITYDDLV